MDKEKFRNTFCKNLTENQKSDINPILNLIKIEKWEKLIDIWKKSSSLLRYSNIKTEFNKIFKNNNNYNNILLLGLQYYVDSSTHFT